MAAHKDPVFETWWPLPRSMDLVRAPVESVAEILKPELKRIIPAETCETDWRSYENMDAVFRSLDVMSNVPTVYLAVPTKSDWTVLVYNCFLCDGYDSLCHNLSRLYGVDTIHWSSSDTDGPFLAGSTFRFRRAGEDGKPARSVQASRDGSSWYFHQRGEPLPGEPVSGYSNRIKRKRLNEVVLMQFFATLGIAPWLESFYDLPSSRCFRLWRPPSPAHDRPTSQVVTGVKR